MKQVGLILLIAFLISVTTFSFVLSQEEAAVNEDSPLIKLCQKQSKMVLKSIMKKFNACTKDVMKMLNNQTAEAFVENIGCVVKCVMRKELVLDDNDIMTEETIRDAVESRVPEQFHTHVHDILLACVKSHGAEKLDAKDPQCKTYSELGYCLQEAFAEVCGTLPSM